MLSSIVFGMALDWFDLRHFKCLAAHSSKIGFHFKIRGRMMRNFPVGSIFLLTKNELPLQWITERFSDLGSVSTFSALS